LWLGPVPEVRYRRWRWEVTDLEVRLQHGLIIIERTVIPMVRVQHVDTTQGPIMRAFGLSDVKVSTAAGVHAIPALADRDADALRDRIAVLARVTDDGGL
jgi:membrane protein YdbS with pleckstrin-like domain